MRLLDGEPEFPIDRWQPVAAVVGRLLAQKPVQGRPFLLTVDGRSANGKSTFADRVASVLPRTSVVHTDDIAWWHSRFGWDDLLVAGVLEPLRQGKPVDYRPPAWDARHRAGSITVPAGAAWVVIEGVGSGRRCLAEHLDGVVWVQTDVELARRRDQQRIAAGEVDQAGYDGWMAEEIPFQAAERTWERADLIVSGAAHVAGQHDVLTLQQ